MGRAAVGFGLMLVAIIMVWSGGAGTTGVVLCALVSPSQLVPADEGC